MKKNLNVTAAVLDLRKVSEETFASYEDIKLQAALVLTTPRVEALLAKYPVEMEAAVSQSCGEWQGEPDRRPQTGKGHHSHGERQADHRRRCRRHPAQL